MGADQRVASMRLTEKLPRLSYDTMHRLAQNVASSSVVSAVDTSIAGDVVRVVVDGFPKLKAKNAKDALQELRADHEEFRHFLIDPPRGYRDINAILLLPPLSPKTDRTVIMAEHFGYVPVAGTLMITAAVALVETGLVARHEPETTVTFDTAHGQTQLIVDVEDGHATSATWTTDRPRIVVRSEKISLENDQTVPVTVISPGLPYVVARIDDLGVDFDDVKALGTAGAMLSSAAGQQLPLKDLGMERDADAYLVMLMGDFTDDGAAEAARVFAAWVAPDGNVSHSPAGTGALTAAAYSADRGDLEIGRLLDVVTPYNQRLRSRIDMASACVAGAVRLVAFVDLVTD